MIPALVGKGRQHAREIHYENSENATEIHFENANFVYMFNSLYEITIYCY